jgi:hypothetical protein
VNEAYHDWIEKKALQKKGNDDDDDDDDDDIANSKIQEVYDGQDKLRISQDQDEMKNKNVTGYASVRKQP